MDMVYLTVVEKQHWLVWFFGTGLTENGPFVILLLW